MTWILPGIFVVALPLAWIVGYCVLAPMSEGYKPFTSPKTAAEDRWRGIHPHRRLGGKP